MAASQEGLSSMKLVYFKRCPIVSFIIFLYFKKLKGKNTGFDVFSQVVMKVVR
jgi:hypothetical protein